MANPDLEGRDALTQWIDKLFEELGEAIAIPAKTVGQGHEFDIEKLKKEQGDCLFYVAMIDHEMRELYPEQAQRFEDLIFKTPAVLAYEEDKLPYFTKDMLRGCGLNWAALAGLLIENDPDPLYDISNAHDEVFFIFDRLEAIAAHIGTSLEAIAQLNKTKLTARFGDQFSAEKSIARVRETA
ncbi:MAG: hypothetical protein AAFX78_10205 [Cyanobacteria bacterium J06638_20]